MKFKKIKEAYPDSVDILVAVDTAAENLAEYFAVIAPVEVHLVGQLDWVLAQEHFRAGRDSPVAEMSLLAAARSSFELEKLEHWEFELCMADQVLGKSLDCSGLAEHSKGRLADLAVDFGASAVHLVVAAVEDFGDPLEDRCSSAVALTSEALAHLVARHAAATKKNVLH